MGVQKTKKYKDEKKKKKSVTKKINIYCEYYLYY